MARDHGPRLRVAVASEQSLVGDSVQAALDDRGLDTVRVAWPSPLRTRRAGRPGAAHRGAVPSVDVGLLLCELDTPALLDQARSVLVDLDPARWLVLTGAPRGSAWGAVLAAGALEVVPSGLTLDEIVDGLQRVATSEPVADDAAPEKTDPLVRQWEVARRTEAVGADRLATLTPREREVLEHLHRGSGVTTIAVDLGISAATVRSQVKAVLRKLQVNSQLAAVAAYAGQVTAAR